MKITLTYGEKLKQFIFTKGYDPKFGARPLKRYIQKYVETLSAKLILSDVLHEKDTILIDVEDGKLVARRKAQ